MGRPKKQAAEARTEQMNTRYTLAEREYIRSQAAAAGLSESDYIRARALGLSVSPARSSRADPALVTELNRIGVNVNQLAAATHMGRDFSKLWQEVGAELRGILTKVVASGS
ncbi:MULTISPECIES: plasmid mobilization protein [unclassified Phaeobacter]|uniref:plasmid mobilization protein n=1 Tax=unclassified Phaeobacter TaxID=2621772 RepID=UPI003A8937F2